MFYEYYVKKIKEVVMKIKMDSVKGFYQKGKAAAKEAVKDAKKQFEEKISPKIEETYESAKQKAEPKVREAIAYAQFAINPPKVEALSKKAAEAQKKYLEKELFTKSLHRNFPNQTNLILAHEKELAKLEQKAVNAVAKYNDFAAKETQAQEAFNNLNNINK